MTRPPADPPSATDPADPADPDPRPGIPPLSRRALLTGTALAAAGRAARPALAGAAVSPAAGSAPAAAALTSAAAGTSGAHQITFDPYSLLVDGTRLFAWSGEFHPFRLPSPSLWLDILQKMKAAGYNAVCMYFNWSYHSPAPGVYDFTGVRDMDLVLRMAADTGLYVLARPGPYINGELNAGGFPGWLTRTAAVARTNDPVYLGYADEWLTAIDAILARHQLTDGGGSVLLYQIENEYASYVTSATGIDYLAHLYAKVRADGITVPIYHNDKGRNGYWVPGSFPPPTATTSTRSTAIPRPAAPRPTGVTTARAGPRGAPAPARPRRDLRPSSAAGTSTRGAALPGRGRATATSGPSMGPPTSGSST